MADATREPEQVRLVGIDRVLAVLTELAAHADGVGLDELARQVSSPKPTVHRALQALRRAGYAVQDGRGRYALGDEFLRLAFAHHELRPEPVRIRPALLALAGMFGETTHYGVLSDRDVVYRAKVDPLVGAARLTSTVGGRNAAHSTALGKALLAYALPDDQAVLDWVAAGPLARPTPNTITEPQALCAELAEIRRLGYAVEDEENEQGIACLAVPVWLTSPSRPSGAVSVSALTYRTPLAALVDRLPEIRAIVTPPAVPEADAHAC